MKTKKKVGLIKRIAAGVCAVMLAVSCFGTVPYYADEYYYTYEDAVQKFRDNKNLILSVDTDLVEFFPDYALDYEYLYLFEKNDIYYLFCSHEVCSFEFNYTSAYQFIWYLNNQEGYYTYSEVDGWSDELVDISFSVFSGGYYYTDSTHVAREWSYEGLSTLLYSNAPLMLEDEVLIDSLAIDSSYNSSLGYLQDIKRQFIYLEDDSFDLVEDTAACKFTFANTTTSGLDITDGNWSIRHYMQIEVKNAKKEYETVDVYDKVFLDEYAATDGKIIYQQKDTVQRLHEESGFDGLSWWESNFLGYITYYNDYFQLVRTNADGSVEYGGYVKVWQDEYNINHSTTLGEDESQDNSGYNDNIVSGSHGSGGTYEEAEKDADENAANSSTSNGEALAELDNILSTISAVPEAFSRMFGFLPDWCLDSIGIAIVAGVAIIIWKTGRG